MFRHIIIFFMPTRWPEPLHMYRRPYREVWTTASGRLPSFQPANGDWAQRRQDGQPRREKMMQKHSASKEKSPMYVKLKLM